MVTDVRLLHHSNAKSPIEVTELGISIELRLLHPSNAPPPIEVTLFGMED